MNIEDFKHKIKEVDIKFSGLRGPIRILSPKTTMLELAIYGARLAQKYKDDGFKPGMLQQLAVRAWCERFHLKYLRVDAFLPVYFKSPASPLFQVLLNHNIVFGNENTHPVEILRMSERLDADKCGFRKLNDCAYLYDDNKNKLIIKSKVSDDLVMFDGNFSILNNLKDILSVCVDDEFKKADALVNTKFIQKLIDFLNLDKNMFIEFLIDRYMSDTQFRYHPTTNDILFLKLNSTYIKQTPRLKEILCMFHKKDAIDTVFDIYSNTQNKSLLKSALISNDINIQNEELPTFS